MSLPNRRAAQAPSSERRQRRPRPGSVRTSILLPPTPPPPAARGPRANDEEGHGDRHQRRKKLERPRGELKRKTRHQHDKTDRHRPTLPANRETGAIAVALRREPFGIIAHVLSSLGGRPRLRGVGFLSFTPRAASASRSRHSTWALTLLSSAAAQRSTAAHKAGSTRNG